MDKLTDILSSFFVSSPRQTRKKRSNESSKELDLKQDKETFTEMPTEQTTIAIQTNYSDNSEVSEVFSQIQHAMDKLNETKLNETKLNETKLNETKLNEASTILDLKQKEDVVENLTQNESLNRKENESSESNRKENESSESNRKENESSESNKKEEESSESNRKEKESSESNKKEDAELVRSRNEKSSILSSLTSSIEDDDNRSILSKTKNENVLKKYILRPSDFYKSNLLIVNDDIKDSVEIVSDLLYKLGLMKDLNVIYDNNIHVITSSENKKEFTKMLLENPYLYFTNFNVKHQLSRKRLRELDNLEKRTIYIIDNKTLTKPLKQRDIQTLMMKNVHVIIIAGEEYNLNQMYNIMGDKRVLIHKLNKSRNMQKHFYKTVIKKISGSKNYLNTFENYSSLINDENVDIKYIILKGSEIRYN